MLIKLTTPHSEVITPRHDKNTSLHGTTLQDNEKTTESNEVTTTYNEEATQHNVVNTTHNEETTQNDDKQLQKTVLRKHASRLVKNRASITR